MFISSEGVDGRSCGWGQTSLSNLTLNILKRLRLRSVCGLRSKRRRSKTSLLAGGRRVPNKNNQKGCDLEACVVKR